MTLDTFAEFEPELERKSREYMGIAPPKVFPLFDMTAMDGPPPDPREWILPGMIPEGEVTLLTGPGGGGKSLFAHQLATCIAARKPFLGMETGNLGEGTVLYVTAEDNTDELHRRQLAIERTVGKCNLKGKLWLSSLRGRVGNELATFDRDGTLERTEAFSMLRDTISATGATFVILDNVAHLFSGNENDRGQVTKFVNLLYLLVRTWGVTIVLIGHPNKSGDAYSGSTAWLNAVRSQIEIARPQGEGEALDPDARVLRVGKANYARQGNELAFRWHDFAFIRDEDLPTDTRAALNKSLMANAENAAFLRCLEAATGRRKAVSETPGTNFFGTVFPRMPEAKGMKKEAFQRAFERLLATGQIELDARLWQRENRAWKFGIRAVDKCTDPPHQPPAPTLAQTIDNACTDPHALTPLYTTYNPGAASQAPAPDYDKCICDDVGCEWCK